MHNFTQNKVLKRELKEEKFNSTLPQTVVTEALKKTGTLNLSTRKFAPKTSGGAKRNAKEKEK
jgi:hypothetical protein